MTDHLLSFQHISHPNITVLLEHLSTPSHHVLVLPYYPGGDLLNLVNDDIAWSNLGPFALIRLFLPFISIYLYIGEHVLRRIWCELCKAVGWMHGVGLVHRDIKLESTLLTFPCSHLHQLTPLSPRHSPHHSNFLISQPNFTSSDTRRTPPQSQTSDQISRFWSFSIYQGR